MQHLAVRSETPLPQWAQGKYQRKQDVRCPRCHTVYALWSPDLEIEREAVDAQAAWVKGYLENVCPNHHEYFLTPDRPEAPGNRYTLR